MRTVQLAVVAMITTLSLVPAAQAARDPLGTLPVRVQPVKPKTTDTLTVTFRAVRLKPDERYEVEFGTYDNTSCTPGYRVRLRRQRPGRPVRVTLSPNPALATGRLVDENRPPNGFNVASKTRFCAGGTELRVTAVDADGKVRPVGHRMIGIAKDPGYPPLTDTPARILLLPGSSVVVRRAGHADRTLALAGQLRGTIAGQIQLGSDIAIAQVSGDLSFPVLEPDVQCSGPRYRTSFAPWREASLVMRQSGDVTFTLPLDLDPASLAGCNEPSAPGRTALTLTGKVGDGGLSKLAVSGTLPGVTLAPGVTGDVTVSLLLNVDLSGRP